MGGRLTRRQALGVLGGAVAAPVVGRALGSVAWAVEDGQNPRINWVPVSNSPAVVGVNRPGDDAIRMFPTMLPIGYLLNGNPTGAPWYLWAWHHDQTKLHIYTADGPEGPFTEHPQSPFIGPPAPGLPAGYNQGHFSSGDIVWDPIGNRLIGTPHGLRPGDGAPCQDSFLIQSTDGLNWAWLDGDNSPRLLCGPPQSVDSVHTGYGRLLRDLDGNLVTFTDPAGGGSGYWWCYRAQRRDAGSTTVFYRPWLATTPSLGTYPWVKVRQAFSAANPSSQALFGVGSFMSAASKKWAYYAEAPTFGETTQVYLMGSTDNDFNLDSVRIPVSLRPVVLSGGPNLIRRPDNHLQYLVQDSIEADPNAVGKLRSRIDIYRASVN